MPLKQHRIDSIQHLHGILLCLLPHSCKGGCSGRLLVTQACVIFLVLRWLILTCPVVALTSAAALHESAPRSVNLGMFALRLLYAAAAAGIP